RDSMRIGHRRFIGGVQGAAIHSRRRLALKEGTVALRRDPWRGTCRGYAARLRQRLTVEQRFVCLADVSWPTGRKGSRVFVNDSRVALARLQTRGQRLPPRVENVRPPDRPVELVPGERQRRFA